MINIIQRAIYSLLQKEPFYAHFILNSNIVYDKFKVPTAAVTVIQGVPTFVFNTEWMGKQTEEGCKTVLKHEVLHLVMDHLKSLEKMPKGEQFLKAVSNIATDCAINQYLESLPDGCVTLQTVEKQVGYALEPFQTSDYYFEHLKKSKWERAKPGEPGLQTLDDHDLDLGDTDAGNEEINRASARGVARKAVAQSAGNAPGAVVKALAMGDGSQLPWRQILRNFILTRVTSSTLNTAKRVNRRFSLPIPGKKRKRTLTLGVCTDSSGSVSDAQYGSFMSELQSICKNVELTWLIQADAQVQKVEKLNSKSKLSGSRHGYGGTAYQPAIDKAKELGCDVIIYFGDFDCADTPTNPKVPFLWVGVGNQAPPADFGKVLRLT